MKYKSNTEKSLTYWLVYFFIGWPLCMAISAWLYTWYNYVWIQNPVITWWQLFWLALPVAIAAQISNIFKQLLLLLFAATIVAQFLIWINYIIPPIIK